MEAVEKVDQKTMNQTGPAPFDLLNLDPNGLLSSLGRYANVIGQDSSEPKADACGTPNFLISKGTCSLSQFSLKCVNAF